jgi:hypothetical protein
MTQQFEAYKKWFSDHEGQKQFPSSLTQSMHDSVFGWKAWQAAQAAQPAPTVPDGYVLVPVEPTEEMLAAVVTSMDDHLFGANAEKQYREDWAAMLAAAPSTKEKTE